MPTLQSGGPRTTPSGYPGGPVVPSGQLSPKVGRRGYSSPYSDNVIRTTSTSGPVSFTRALEVTDSLAGGMRAGNGARVGTEEHRESVYDMNYEVSVRHFLGVLRCRSSEHSQECSDQGLYISKI